MGNEPTPANVAKDARHAVGARSHAERMAVQGSVAMVKAQGRHVEVEGFAPGKVLIDTGAEPVLLG